MPDTAIEVNQLSKRYRIGVERDDTLRDAVANTLRSLTARRSRDAGVLWALKDVSFNVSRGEAVAVIGRNGSGKSTLLKILSRITSPTSGRAVITGRVSSLLEVGTGFHQELTGRENIYLSGAILGMRRVEINRKFDEIVAFSEIEKFLDTPVKRYSSGMHVRLGFAVAAHLEPEILLVDEVLAVGDVVFQKKCLGKMGDVTQSGRTVLFVSHNMAAVNQLCQRSIWLDNGMLLEDDDTPRVVAHYLAQNNQAEGEWILAAEAPATPDSELVILAVRILDDKKQVASVLDVRKPYWVEIQYQVQKTLPFCRVGFIIDTSAGVTLFEAYDADNQVYHDEVKPGSYTSQCQVPGDLLMPGRYLLTVNAGMVGVRKLDRKDYLLSFDIEDTGAVGSHLGGRRKGFINPKLQWVRRQNS